MGMANEPSSVRAPRAEGNTPAEDAFAAVPSAVPVPLLRGVKKFVVADPCPIVGVVESAVQAK